MDALDGCYEILSYHSYTCGTVRAVIAIVQIGSKLGGTYRFERRDNGEVPWGAWPTSDGVVGGEVCGESAHRAPDGQPWRWQLSLAGTACFAKRVEDGRIGLARAEDARYFADHMTPIQDAPGGEPYRDLVRYAAAILRVEPAEDAREADLRKTFVAYVDTLLAGHPAVRSTIPDSERLVRGEPVDVLALHEAAEREAAREERVFLDGLRADWASRLRDGT